MITNPTYTTPNRVTCVPGYEKLLVATINDPSSTPVIVTVGGTTYTSGSNLTLTARSTICWTGVIDLSGLVANTRYSWSVRQGSNSDKGSYYHTPNTGTDFRLYFNSCDNNTLLTNQTNNNPYKVSGYWQYIKEQYDSGIDIAGMMFVDDYGYVDSMSVKDDGSGSYETATGLVSGGQPSTTAALDDYLIGWCGILGMLGPTRTEYTTDELANNDLLRVLWGREENRAFCRKNINIFPQWGDHEFTNDLGWDIQPSSTSHFANGKTAWNAFLGLLQPDISDLITPADTGANHWVTNLGDLCIGSLDYITNVARTSWIVGNEAVVYGNSTQITQFTTLLGNNQIDDYLNAVNVAAKPFTLLGTQFSIRYLVTRTGSTPPNAFTTTISERGFGAQHPLYDHCLADYARLFTESGNTPASIMDNSRTNGATGTFLMLGGDMHVGQVISCNHPAYTGNLAESFWHMNQGTVNGSNTTIAPEVAGTDIADCTVQYADTTSSNDVFFGMYVDIVGSETTKKLTVTMADKNDEILLQKQFVQYRGGNEGYDTTVDLTDKSSGIVASE